MKILPAIRLYLENERFNCSEIQETNWAWHADIIQNFEIDDCTIFIIDDCLITVESSMISDFLNTTKVLDHVSFKQVAEAMDVPFFELADPDCFDQLIRSLQKKQYITGLSKVRQSNQSIMDYM